MNKLRIGIDTGGTFTDFVMIRGGRIDVFKELSTPESPEEAILTGLGRFDADPPEEIIHGSTVATNALLERKGARTALVTTAGFEDVLVIGRQTRSDLYNIFTTRPDPLIPATLRLGVTERVLYDGSVEKKLSSEELLKLVRRLRRSKVESVAVSLLFSFANPSHEEKIAEALGELGVPVSLSSSILPEYREYERTSTTTINAYLAPVMSRYLGRLQMNVSDCPLSVMQSNGGTVRAETAMAAPVKTILSGPAGGVVGAFFIARKSGYPKIITFDMGGTSTDVALCDGDVRVTHESQVDGMPIGIPMMDIHTVGAGGGSIADFDAGGALKVGPDSAGADPGPICYGKGESLTVTDANLILGRLRPRFFLGGAMSLTPQNIEPRVRRLAWTEAWPNLESLAKGVIDVVNSNMEQAIRLISVERGHDPRDFSLMCFGGAGALHAASLAQELSIPRVIVPPHPGALSALGLLLSDVRKDYSRTMLGTGKVTRTRIRKCFADLHRMGVGDLAREGFKRGQITMQDFLDVRYVGQSYELTIPYSDEWLGAFHQAHDRRYGHSNSESPVEVVSARSTLLGLTEKPRLRRAVKKAPRPRAVETGKVWFDDGWEQTPVYDRVDLGFGNVIRGPAVIGEYSSTTLVPPRFRCEVDRHLNLVLSPER